MTEKQLFIEDAIKGGWTGYKIHGEHPNIAELMAQNEDMVAVALLDPTFWQSVGKTRGWGNLHCTNCGEHARPIRKYEDDPEYWHDCCGRERRLEYGVNYVKKWQTFVGCLADWFSIEQSLKAIR